MCEVKILASDLDGTLLNPDHEPAAGTFEAIAEYQKAGGIFAVCTGRDKGSARGVLKGLDIDRMPGVYMNGTIVQGKNGEPLQSVTIPQTVVDSLVQWGRQNREDASILFVVGDTHYVMDKSEEYALFMHKHLLDPEPEQVEGGWTSDSPAVPTGINLMRVICHPDKMSKVKPQVQRLVAGKANCAQSLPTTMDIMCPNTNKASGLHVLLQALGLSEADACAIGDSENDLEMLQSVRVACAMGNAHKVTKSVAHYIMPKNVDSPAGVVALLGSLTSALQGVRPIEKPPVPVEKKYRVAVFGGMSWGSAVARLVGQTCLQLPQFETEVSWWLENEVYGGHSLADAINSTHENEKWLPGLRLPRNVTATESAQKAAADADVLIFVERYQGLPELLRSIKGVVKSTAVAVNMAKDYFNIVDGHIMFGSGKIKEELGIPAAALMGGTIAGSVARGHFAEATLGCDDEKHADVLLALFNRPNFHVRRVPSPEPVEMFAVLKSIISLASGFSDGIGLGYNSKAAIVRLGAVEISRFAKRFYPQKFAAYALHEACGWTDLIVSSCGGARHQRCAEFFVKHPSLGWEEISVLVLGASGFSLAGVRTAKLTMNFICQKHCEAEFPFISKIYRITQKLDEPSTLTDMHAPKVRNANALKVCVLGSGNWGTAIARIISKNVLRDPDFQKTVNMWVHEEMIDDRKLTEIINTDHENVKYLPGFNLPTNLVAVPDAVEAVKDAHILVFVLPHQFLNRLLDSISGHTTPGVMAVSLIKGHMVIEDGGATLRTGTQVIAEKLGIGSCAVLNGANVANDVATGNFAEATLGCDDEEAAPKLMKVFDCQNFSVRTVPDTLGVELFGGFKNVIALAAGFSDGLELSENTKAAVLRRGLLEMAELVRELFPSSRAETVEESCGFADLLTTCYSGRNRKCAEAFARDPAKSWEDIEKELLGGQKLQGPSCCMDVQAVIEHRGLRPRFPLMSAIYDAVTKKISPQDVFTCNGFLAVRPTSVFRTPGENALIAEQEGALKKVGSNATTAASEGGPAGGYPSGTAN
eukprot:TRINITY_DN19717_c0_g3_i1.p1 TRINITY_DN19717_c0_g3~~TRINITY_DN19717_c0_g3_i1.p1  ORF type:complete len:1043 (-),score=254.61 TRINITY_DN19717_c0_g3_i1:322-3450(-)